MLLSRGCFVCLACETSEEMETLWRFVDEKNVSCCSMRAASRRKTALPGGDVSAGGRNTGQAHGQKAITGL